MNRTTLTACIAELAALRYTPAGLPALDLMLEHASEQSEVGQNRKVQLKIRALALGSQAERLIQQPVGSVWQFQGFLATPRQGKSVVLHIQEFQQD
ncbi:primosomal replication protein N [Limnohabitans radicicola]|uniref:Replication restart protein PriB n=1 Tax=Limnohabitans radicicola TaxID=2771427 RepID=A0A927FG78_9BURK|nr:primosomal replication protein N [Limnohabitans radicicola]